MCGRYVQKSSMDVLQKEFGIQEVQYEWNASYNVAPSQHVAAVVQRDVRELIALGWGLIPSWAKDPKIAYKLINARGETLKDKPSFRKAFKEKRCLILGDGFYEWRKAGKTKQPVYITLKSKEPFAFAGLWETWKSPDGKTINTCTIVTTEANSLMKTIHSRMPVILRKDQEALWLNTDLQDGLFLESMIKPYESEVMEAVEVSHKVNSTEENSPQCIEPVDSMELW